VSSSSTDRAIHVAAYTDSSEFGGAEKHLAALVRELAGGIQISVLGTNPAIIERVSAGRADVTVRSVRPVANKRDMRGIGAHMRAIREIRPDVLHASLRHPWSCQYALSAGLLTAGVRTIAVHHAMLPPRNRRQVWLNRLNLRRLDGQVAVSRAGALFVEQLVGLESSTVRVIHNGVPDSAATPLARPVSGPIIGSVGRLSPEKGFDVLLRALPALPEVTVILVGDGPLRGDLERLAAELEVAERVRMVGWRDDPGPWLPTFDVFVMPSRMEALGLAIIEAMIASRPVVASSVGGIPDVVVDGETGLLVPAADPAAMARGVRDLLADPRRRDRMGKAGRDRALRRFGLRRMVDRYESLYEELARR
jgi:glycosyltransferase involved in cell wall biosynthesis